MRTTRQCLHSKDNNTICDNNHDLFGQQKPNDFFKMSFLLFFLSNSLSRGNTKGCLTKHIALNNYALKKNEYASNGYIKGAFSRTKYTKYYTKKCLMGVVV